MILQFTTLVLLFAATSAPLDSPFTSSTLSRDAVYFEEMQGKGMIMVKLESRWPNNCILKDLDANVPSGVRIPRYRTGKTLREKDPGVLHGVRETTQPLRLGVNDKIEGLFAVEKFVGECKTHRCTLDRDADFLRGEHPARPDPGLWRMCGWCLGHLVDSGPATTLDRPLGDAISEARGVTVARARAILLGAGKLWTENASPT